MCSSDLVRAIFEANADHVTRLKLLCSERVRENSVGNLSCLRYVQFLAAMAYSLSTTTSSSSPQHGIEIGNGITEAQMTVIRDEVFLGGGDRSDIDPVLVRKENESRSHLLRSGYLRPGESLYMYLGMCGCTWSNDVRFFGALRLALQIRALIFDDANRDFEPYDTISARRYAERALEARLRNDARLLHRDVEELRMEEARNKQTKGPHALFAESVLQLATTDVDDDVRRLGMIAWNSVPAFVQRQAVWRPSLHASFGRHERATVITMLVLAYRGDLPIPRDVMIRVVFPFACDASSSREYEEYIDWDGIDEF